MAADPHMLLAAASLVPGLGSLAAAMDMALYLYEGDSFNAALAAAALIPGGAMLAIGVGKGARALFNLARSGAKDLGAAVKASRVFRGLAGGARAVKSVVSRVSTRISKWVGSKVEAARTKVKGWLGRRADSPQIMEKNGTRTLDGKYTSADGVQTRSGAAAEVQAWDDLERSGFDVQRGRIYADVDGQTRIYDGMARKPGQPWKGIEVKSGTSPRTPRQRELDDWLRRPGNAATVFGEKGRGRTLVDVLDVRIP
jgi:hypothetical protein